MTSLRTLHHLCTYSVLLTALHTTLFQILFFTNILYPFRYNEGGDIFFLIAGYLNDLGWERREFGTHVYCVCF